MGPTECMWKHVDPPNSFMVDMDTHILLSANNSLGNSSITHTIKTKDRGRLVASTKLNVFVEPKK